MKAVRFERYGGPQVLEVVEVDRPVPAPDELLVAVKAAGMNPGEIAIREGLLESRFPTTFPCGEGTDFAGVVTIEPKKCGRPSSCRDCSTTSVHSVFHCFSDQL